MALTISEEGLRFIMKHEGLRLELYNDPAGHCTIGVGHLVHRGPCDGSEPQEFRNGITQERALEMLRQDASSRAADVNAAVSVELTQNQFDALVSFVFNMGAGAFRDSTLLRELNKGNYDEVPNQLARWVHADGEVLEGLVTRRQEEAELWGSASLPLADDTAVMVTVAGSRRNYVTDFVTRRHIRSANEREELVKAGLPAQIHEVSQSTLDAIPEVE